jgi:ribosomal protein L3
MASQRQIQDKRESTQEDSLGIEDAEQVSISAIGKQLTKLGRSLSKSEDLDYLEALDTVVDILEQKPQKIDTKQAMTTIDLWYEILHKSEDSSLKAISIELKDLKQLLKKDKIKSADLSQKMIEIGTLTTAIAATAGRGFKGVINKLGKVLITFGKSLA